MKTIIHHIDRINETVGRVVAWFNIALIILVCFDVTRRYLFKDSAAWIMELEWHIFAMIFLLSAGFTLKHDKHVRVDLFYEKFSEREKAWINVFGGIIFLLPWCIIVIYTGYDYAQSAFVIGESSPDPGGLPGRYVIKAAIPLGFLLLFLQGLAMILRQYSELSRKM